jgi:hypothetical protein
MPNNSQGVQMERIDRRQLLAAGGGAALLSAIMGTGLVSAQQGTARTGPTLGVGYVKDWVLRYNVIIDPATISQTRTATTSGAITTGPFYFSGPIYAEGGINTDGTVSTSAIVKGVHRAYGWVFDAATPNAFILQSFDFFGLGKLTSNSTTIGPAAVTGGTGQYKTAQGEVRAAVLNAARGAYLLEFALNGGSPGM